MNPRGPAENPRVPRAWLWRAEARREERGAAEYRERRITLHTGVFGRASSGTGSRGQGRNSSGAPRARLALALATLCLLPGCESEPPPPEPLRPVRHERVVLSGAGRTRIFSGRARAGQEINLSFRVSGRVDSLPAKVGDVVRAGHLIAQLEQIDYEIAQRRAQANVEQADAAYINAQANLERIEGLYEDNNASRNELDQAIAGYDQEAARRKEARESLRQAQRQLGYTSLRAPVDGAIAAVDVEVNENVSAGQNVFRLTAGSRSEVEVAIPGVLISQINKGNPVGVTFSALPGQIFDAVVTEVGVAALGASTTFPVTVRLARSTNDVRSGMAAEVSFRFEGDDDSTRIFLPAYAVGEDSQGRFVFLLERTDVPDVGRVRRQSVEVGEELTPDGKLEILAHLSEGDDVVTAGVRRLIDGQNVTLLDQGSSP